MPFPKALLTCFHFTQPAPHSHPLPNSSHTTADAATRLFCREPLADSDPRHRPRLRLRGPTRSRASAGHRSRTTASVRSESSQLLNLSQPVHRARPSSYPSASLRVACSARRLPPADRAALLAASLSLVCELRQS